MFKFKCESRLHGAGVQLGNESVIMTKEIHQQIKEQPVKYICNMSNVWLLCKIEINVVFLDIVPPE